MQHIANKWAINHTGSVPCCQSLCYAAQCNLRPVLLQWKQFQPVIRLLSPTFNWPKDTKWAKLVLCLLVHEASVGLVPPGLTVPSLGATDRASVLKLHSAKPSVFMGNLRGRMKNRWWVYTRHGEGGKEIIKNKLMRGINYSINSSNVPPRAEFRGRNGKMRETAREKMSSREVELRGEWDMKRKKRGGLALLLECEIEAP